MKTIWISEDKTRVIRWDLVSTVSFTRSVQSTSPSYNGKPILHVNNMTIEGHEAADAYESYMKYLDEHFTNGG